MLDAPDLSTPLYGHDAAQKQIAAAIANQRVPGAYLLSGQRGIGKATLAWHVAATLLTGGVEAPAHEESLFGDALPSTAPAQLNFDANDPAISRMQQGSHSDFMWLRPVWDDKKKAFKSEISVEQVRKIGQFLSLTAGEKGWKVVIIDSADIMNNAAANALLKWLEEPPSRTLFLLVAHRAGALLPTIISRCRAVALTAPDKQAFARITGASAETESTSQLYDLTAGSPGLAQLWQRTSWQKYWATLLEISGASRFDVKKATSFSATLTKDADFPLSSVQRLFETLLLNAAKITVSQHVDSITELETQTYHHIAQTHPRDTLQGLWKETLHIFNDAESLYLNKPHLLFNMMAKIQGAA